MTVYVCGGYMTVHVCVEATWLYMCVWRLHDCTCGVEAT